MTIELVDMIFRFAAGGILGLLIVLILRDRRDDFQGWLAFGLALSVGAFLIASCSVFYKEGFGDLVLRQASAFMPALLWLTTLSLKRSFRWHWWVAAPVALLALVGALRGLAQLNDAGANFFYVVHSLLAAAMLTHGIWRAYGRRRSTRSASFQFAAGAALLGAAVIYVDPIGHGFDLPFSTEFIASSVTFALVLITVAQCLSLPGETAIEYLDEMPETAVASNDVGEDSHASARRRSV